MANVGFLSLPTELICYILFLLTPRDLCRCAIAACKTFRDAAQNCVRIQHKLELFARGIIETTTQDSIQYFKTNSSLKKFVFMSQSDFHVNTIFQKAVAAAPTTTKEAQFMKYGLWWTSREEDLLIQECNTNTRTWPNHNLSPMPQHVLAPVIVDPLQDLVITISLPRFVLVNVHNVKQDHHVFWLEFRMLSSQIPHEDLACTSLDCKHYFDARGNYDVVCMKEPAVYGDRIVVPYYTHTDNRWRKTMFIQVIDWRKGQAKSHNLGYQIESSGDQIKVHLIDQQTFVVIDLDGVIMLYTLQELDGSPQHRISYFFPTCTSARAPSCIVHTTPSFPGAVVRPDLVPNSVPSLESQIMVLEMALPAVPMILVIDMIIFSEKNLHPHTAVSVPWSDWGPRYTCCFPHDPSHRISVFGSRMAYALPRYRTPAPGHRLEALSTNGRFYVHIWDFNERVIARSKNFSGFDSPGLLIYKPARLVHPGYNRDFTSDHFYSATVCHASFPTRDFQGLFLEQDRLTLTWVRPDVIDIQVVSPVLERQ
ncbi:hypothetical protein DEU56DRAFT_825580 [Suillus clintonianus]|uniref:uncharacterized protein n=1 Tax=Suillus clintonianus TaxID=1904413 RepID=UPI001B8829AD|nr:uncharacterized protein DEU56DRAFT_825580 [Suillus clintonianus]KAG2125419.1 hypothetical protein DEU56DRAFT_825580 [Suillus clintonianus]